MQKCTEITTRLEVALGPGTGGLRMRFGLHSGPGKEDSEKHEMGRGNYAYSRISCLSKTVTAGVLRGEKSRFQLFGDTVSWEHVLMGDSPQMNISQLNFPFKVNTASRIESTGQRNRIQVSQQTADLLSEAGKEKWVVPRNDLVEAK